jgi:cell division protein FtsI (penicillin-binding protein 3)
VKSRLIVLLGLLVAWSVVLTGRLHRVQVSEHDRYAARAEGQQLKRIELVPPRATILDAKGRKLAVSIEVDSVVASGAVDRPRETATAITRVLGGDADELAKKLGTDGWKWIARQIEPEAAEHLRDLDLDGIDFVRESKRFYPQNSLAGPVLGFVGVDHTGLAGVEAAYDGAVSGEPVVRMLLRDALNGRAVSPGLSFLDADPGQDLYLTIDAGIQYVVERELQRAIEEHSAKAASAVFMDPLTGAVYAMASLPSFDPNRYGDFPPERWRNRVVQDAFEPGSTLKLITAAAALEANLLDPLDVLDCERGGITMGSVRIRDHKPFDLLTFGEVIAKSSNVGAIKAGLLVGPERLYRQLDVFGFGRKTGIDLPGESTGILRPVDRWSRHEIAYAAIGQGVSVTALQVARAFAVVANGGYLVRPHIVSSIGQGAVPTSRPEGSQVVSAATIRTLLRMLETVVEDGTGARAAVATYRVAGKTGTAQKAGRSGYVSGRYIASFAGFAPSREPRIVGVVAIDEPRGRYHGGEAAAPVFSKILNQVMPLLGIAPDVPSSVAPDSTFRVAQNSTRSPDGAGLRPGSSAVPELPRTAPGAVPDFSGLSARQALTVAARAGVDVRLEGSGFVHDQKPAPGGDVGDLESVILRLESGRSGRG